MGSNRTRQKWHEIFGPPTELDRHDGRPRLDDDALLDRLIKVHGEPRYDLADPKRRNNDAHVSTDSKG